MFWEAGRRPVLRRVKSRKVLWTMLEAFQATAPPQRRAREAVFPPRSETPQLHQPRMHHSGHFQKDRGADIFENFDFFSRFLKLGHFSNLIIARGKKRRKKTKNKARSVASFRVVATRESLLRVPRQGVALGVSSTRAPAASTRGVSIAFEKMKL